MYLDEQPIQVGEWEITPSALLNADIDTISTQAFVVGRLLASASEMASLCLMEVKKAEAGDKAQASSLASALADAEALADIGVRQQLQENNQKSTESGIAAAVRTHPNVRAARAALLAAKEADSPVTEAARLRYYAARRTEETLRALYDALNNRHMILLSQFARMVPKA